MIEDDVFVNGRVKEFPKHAGGSNGNRFPTIFTKLGWERFIKQFPKLQFNFWNLAGGSIIHSQTLKECIEKTDMKIIYDYDKFCHPYVQLWHTNDVLLSVILMINGKTNDEAWTNSTGSNLIHPDKRFYKGDLGIDEGVFRKNI